MDCLIQEKLLMSRRYVVYLITVMINVPQCAVTGNTFDFSGHSGALLTTNGKLRINQRHSLVWLRVSRCCSYFVDRATVDAWGNHGHLSDKPNKQKQLGDKWQRCRILTLLGKKLSKGKKNKIKGKKANWNRNQSMSTINPSPPPWVTAGAGSPSVISTFQAFVIMNQCLG